MKVSVIVTTYNRPDALAAVLEGFLHQQGVATADWEVVVADDGSGEETRRVVASYQGKMEGRLLHAWQEDKGFRAAEARNLAVTKSTGDYLIFLDGDCIPCSDFIQEHMRLAEAGWFIAGNRVLMSAHFTEQYLAGSIKPVTSWSLSDWLCFRSRKEINNALGWLRLALPGFRKKKPKDWKLFRTCNAAVWRNDFYAVDGFDCTFSGWGYEDSDLAVRLLRLGVKIKNGRFAVPVLHLWHHENDRSQHDENWARFEHSLHGQHVWAEAGLSALGGEEKVNGRGK
ncbi:glycosyltransferase family 2 protein [Craterilacuibacter sinensis]|uniref:Glycosyltransferase n=1 Tax=Craterilacuibacter sinensis TaxID=2686017 RepID=A0A845BNR8_9NEIS|nr:glycosyltransferase family 2 protein [Craterilacuibacter sinensis]MXR37939.1 glycosyltransferase [Craterilacuibacter sinensis]